MNLLVGVGAQPEVQEAVFFAVAAVLDLDVDVLLFRHHQQLHGATVPQRESCACRGPWG